MRRRNYVATSLLLTVPLAGCTDGSDNDGGDDTDNSQSASNDDGDGTAGDSQGGTDDDGGDDTDDDSQTSTDTPEEPASEFADEADGQVQLAYGETAALSTGVEVTVHGIEVTDAAGDEEPEERDAFAWVEVEAFNDSDGPNDLPHGSRFELLFEDQQIDWTINSAAYREAGRERYEGEEIQGGVRRRGYVLFEVDEGHDQSTIDVLWDDILSEVNARWSDQ